MKEQAFHILREDIHPAVPEQAVVRVDRKETGKGLHVHFQRGEEAYHYSLHWFMGQGVQRMHKEGPMPFFRAVWIQGVCGCNVSFRPECPNYERDICPLLGKPPYVCKGCSKRPRCKLPKTDYRASEADKKYRVWLKELRSGVPISEEEARGLAEIFNAVSFG